MEPEPTAAKIINAGAYRMWLGDEQGESSETLKRLHAYRGAGWRADLERCGVEYTPAKLDELCATRTFAELTTFFSENRTTAPSKRAALQFYRVALAHYAAYIADCAMYVVASTELVVVDDVAMYTIVDDIVPAIKVDFAWYVRVQNVRYHIIFNEKMVAFDPALRYARVTTVLANPASRQYTRPTLEPSTLNLAAPFLHAADYAGKTQDELAQLADAAQDDPDVAFVLGHFERLMRAPEGASAAVKEGYAQIGQHLYALIAECIQRPRPIAQIAVLLSPVQQCGKTTILAILYALLGHRLVLMMPVEELNSPFLAVLRGRLFVFFDEGAAVLDPKHLDSIKRLTANPQFQSSEKHQAALTTQNYLTAFITTNRSWLTVPAGSERIKVYPPIGDLQHDRAYFDQLYGLLSRRDVMSRAFLVMSQVHLRAIDGRKFDPADPVPLCSRFLMQMADPQRGAVYTHLESVLAEIGTGHMPIQKFEDVLQRTVDEYGRYRGERANVVAKEIAADLRLRSVITPRHASTLVRAVDGAAPCVAAREEHDAWLRAAEGCERDEFDAWAFAHGVDADALIAAGVLREEALPARVTTCLRIREGVRVAPLKVRRRGAAIHVG